MLKNCCRFFASVSKFYDVHLPSLLYTTDFDFYFHSLKYSSLKCAFASIITDFFLQILNLTNAGIGISEFALMFSCTSDSIPKYGNNSVRKSTRICVISFLVSSLSFEHKFIYTGWAIKNATKISLIIKQV